MSYRPDNSKNQISNTLLSTKATTVNKLPNKNSSPKNIDDKDYFCIKDNMVSYIEKIYPEFYEQFELNNFINSGSVGYVYEGSYKYSCNNQKNAFKICIDKKRDEKKDEKKKRKK